MADNNLISEIIWEHNEGVMGDDKTLVEGGGGWSSIEKSFVGARL